jgi:hypothetical protein
MIVKLLVVGSLAFAGGSAAKAIDAYAGAGTTKAGVGAGVDQMTSMWGEAAEVPGKLMTEMKPGFQNMTGQVGNVLNGPSTTLPASNDVPTQDGGDQ